MVTIKDIAKRAQVSISTVSLALNGDPRVKESTQKRILSIAEEMHYHPNHAAKSLPSGRTWSISVINPTNSPALSSGFYSQFLHGVHTVAKDRHYSVSLSLIDDDHESLVRMMDEHRTDGLIIMNPSFSISILDQIRSRNIPYVLLGSVSNETHLSVDSDNFSIGYDAATVLLKEKRSRILFLSGPSNLIFSQDRLQGYKKAHEEFQCPVDSRLFQFCDGFSKSALTLVSDILEKRDMAFDGIIAMSDALAIGAMAAIRRKGIRIPDEMGIIGINNDDISEFTEPPLSSVDLNAYKLGENAASMLLKCVESLKNGEDIGKERIVVPHTVIFRGTTF